MTLAAQNYWMLLAGTREDQREHGSPEGLCSALERTGSLFLGSGLIVAGMFASFMAGSLVGLKQLGFALTCGMLLDAVVIRPLLIPACLLMKSQKSAAPKPQPNSPAGEVLLTKNS
jgi:uncharacterized membrane protein YdfJ with MMPL/SSD domain